MAQIELGLGRAALPGISDINLFCYCQGIVYLDAEISDGAFDLGGRAELDGPRLPVRR